MKRHLNCKLLIKQENLLKIIFTNGKYCKRQGKLMLRFDYLFKEWKASRCLVYIDLHRRSR